MPQRTYRLDLFTLETWSEISHVNYETTGFRANRKTHATKARSGDLFLCYLTGKSRFVGVLEALSESYRDETPSDPFPVRFKTRLLHRIDEDRGVHLHEVVEQSEHARSWSGYYRGSPQRLPATDGEFILRRLREIEQESAQLPSEPPIAIEIRRGRWSQRPNQRHRASAQRRTIAEFSIVF